MNKKKLILDGEAPLDSAKKFRALERPHLIRQQGTWYDFAGDHYRELESDTVAKDVQKFLASALRGRVLHDGKGEPIVDANGLAKLTFPKDKAGDDILAPFQPHPGDVMAVQRMLGHGEDVHKEAGTLKPPVWLDGRDGASESARLILPCRNGLFDFSSRELIAHTPNFFCTYCLPINYDPNVAVPQLWLDTLLQMMDGREHLVSAMQEIFGYAISQERSMEKMVLFRGRSRSGKSTVLKVLRALCGETNVASLSMNIFGEKYGLENCVDKLLLVIPDYTADKRTDISTAAERMKNISGGDPLDVRRMARVHLSNVVFPGLCVIASNMLPNFGASAPALIERLLGVPFEVYFGDKPDTTLKARLTTIESLTGILNWAIEGYDRLMARGHFKDWPESIAIKTKLLATTSSAAAFIASRCILSSEARAETEVLWQAYLDFCEQAHLQPEDKNWFLRNLSQAVTDAGGNVEHMRKAGYGLDGRPRQGWRGIRLRDDFLPLYYQHDETMLDLAGAESVGTLMQPLTPRDFAKDDFI